MNYRKSLFLFIFINIISTLSYSLYLLTKPTLLSHPETVVKQTVTVQSSRAKGKPHIVLIVADDLGWNDVGYHGSEIDTPNINRHAAEGIKLENYYVQPLSTPTRSVLLSGRYQIHTGLQHDELWPCRPGGLPLNISTIADELRRQGYTNHLVGKWHLGFHQKEYMPMQRGFDSHFGPLLGFGDHFTHIRLSEGNEGVDFWENGRPTDAYRGCYSTDVFISHATKLVENHDTGMPMFLYLSFQGSHSSLKAPERFIEKYNFMKNDRRRHHAGMVSAMDAGVGKLTNVLKTSRKWNDTVVVFTTMNGGEHVFGGSNYPLRGERGSHWEGGIRGVGFVSGGYITNRGEINRQLLHVSDWYPTLLNLAGGDASTVKDLDGFDQWETITKNKGNRRKEILINVDPLAPTRGVSASTIFDTSTAQAALRSGYWKILVGFQGFDRWRPQPPKHKESPQQIRSKRSIRTRSASPVLKSLANWLSFRKHHANNNIIKPSKNISEILKRDKRFIRESQRQYKKNLYLFDIAEDPEEKYDVSEKYPEIVKQLLKKIAYYNSTAIPVHYPPPDEELRCNPQLHDGFWQPWNY